jgi:inositol oxygenase
MNDGPMDHLDDWEECVSARYPAAASVPSPDSSTPTGTFRDYSKNVRPAVREFYRLNHRHQTMAFVEAKKRQYLPLRTRLMGVWEAAEFLNTLVDESDPDTDFSQIEHLLQTAEAIRSDGHPRWFILTGLVHDLGKILCLWGEPQWAVVGDTFPVGCAFSDKVVFPEFFAENPDLQSAECQTANGIYSEGCGLDAVQLSWGHDEYMYQVAKNYLPDESLAMIRYHSCYAIHREGAYGHLLNDRDRELMKWVRAFSQYDLYSKAAERPDVRTLRPFYEDLVAEYFPPVLDW